MDLVQMTLITPTAAMHGSTHGGRAKCLQRLIRLDMPVPRTVALPFPTVRAIAQGQMPDLNMLLAEFDGDALLSVRPSSQDPDWGGPGAILNIGMNDAHHATLSTTLGETAATALYVRFLQAYAVDVAHLDPDEFETDQTDAATLDRLLAAYKDEADEPFPQDPARQLAGVLSSMARAWEGTSARILREARGAPADAGLGLVVQEMALGVGPAESGSGVIQFVSSDTGEAIVTGRYLSQSQGRDAIAGTEGAIYLTRDDRGPSLEELCPGVFADLLRFGGIARTRLREEMQVEFTVSAGVLYVLDAVRIARTSRAAVQIAVTLAEDGVIPKSEALLRIEPRALNELLHRQVDRTGARDVVARGIAASPGAATGVLVFSAEAAQANAARGEPSILARHETTPEDIRGMHAAVAVLTERGGMTSHAAMIARGLGLPCVVGASRIAIDAGDKTLTTRDGRVLKAGDVVTLDGSAGEALAGAARLLEPALGDSFRTLMDWASDHMDIGVRANADTAAEAQVAATFGASGIGLCRTEHMFYEADRLTVVREMIFADGAEDRQGALDRLLPMQRADFAQLFRIMEGRPVCIRLLDPPLHEFLPNSKSGLRELADALGMPLKDVTRRVASLSEFNPMLGMRGVRLGVAMPEIYEMQARAIFEATVEAQAAGNTVVPEVMIPLVSAVREVELVKARIDAVAASVGAESGVAFSFRLGVMVETPRAALRADEIARYADFLSFGTNDLTQMTYGLSRDDAGRFMSEYVTQGVFPEDPFHRLDEDGVGELLRIGAQRGRAARPDVTLSICGEHGGDPESIEFCRRAGYDYVSASPFRVPLARLAAAQLAIRAGVRVDPDAPDDFAQPWRGVAT